MNYISALKQAGTFKAFRFMDLWINIVRTPSTGNIIHLTLISKSLPLNHINHYLANKDPCDIRLQVAHIYTH